MFAVFPVQFDDPYPDLHILKLLCQIISNGAAAYDHGIFYLIGLQTYLAENSAAFLGVAMMEMTSPSCKIKLPSGI